MKPDSCIRLLADVLLKTASADDDLLLNHLVANGCDQRTAQQAIQLIPIAFGRRFLSDMGITFSDLYWEFSAAGELMSEQSLSENPLFKAASDLAPKMWTKSAVQAIALRSSEVHAVNEAMNNGSKPENLRMAPIVLFLSPPTDSGFKIAETRMQQFLNQSGAPRTEKNKPWWCFW